MLNRICLFIILNFFIGVSSLLASPNKVEIAFIPKKIVGYFPNWGVYGTHRNYYVKHIPWDKLTHIQVAFAKVEKDTFKISTPDTWADLDNPYGEAWNSKFKGNYGQLRKIKVAHPHVSVLISIGGWTFSSQFANASSSDIKAKLFASQAVKFMKEHGFDGIDIKWEFPTKVRVPDKIDNINDEGTLNETPASKQGFTRLLKELRAKLNTQGASDGRYYQLTAATSSSPALINNTEPDKYIKYLDFLNIMSYDLHGSWDKTTNHQSPLYSNPNLPQYGIYVDSAVTLFHETYGVPKNKLIIGSPFYSRGWKGVDCSKTKTLKNLDGTKLPGLNCPTNGGSEGRWDGGRTAGVNSWFDIVHKMRGKDGFVTYRDNYAKVPYLYSSSKKEFYTYEDEISVQAKTDYVNSNDYGGIVVWELSADTRTDLSESLNTSLLNIIYKGFYPKSSISKTIVGHTKIKPIDESQNQDTMIEDKIKISSKKTNKAIGSANTDGGIKPFDANHGPQNNKHYEKGEQVSYNRSTCTAKWWVNKNPKDNANAWTCDFGIYIPPITELSNTKKETAKASIYIIEKSLTIDRKISTIINNVIFKIAKKAVQESSPSYSSYADIDILPLKPAYLRRLASETNKCHKDKIYLNGDLCSLNGKWYKFSRWTIFNGSITSVMKKLNINDAEIPTLEVVNAGSIPIWSTTKIYSLKGIKVVYDAHVFESKWWTQGDMPKAFVGNTPWKHLGIANKTSKASKTYQGVLLPSANNVSKITTSLEVPIVIANDVENTIATFDPETNKTVHTKMNPGEEIIIQTAPSEKTFFMPFIDTTLWPPYKLSEGLYKGIKNFALSFINSSGGNCNPTWGNYSHYNIENTTLNLPSQIKEISKAGGSVMVSFGGGVALNDELANVCNSVPSLAKAYQEVIDKTGVKMIDFNIEGANSYNQINVRRRMKALKVIQDNNPNIQISFTLATMPTGLLAPSGLMIVKTAVYEEIKFSMINLMLTDYGTSYPANIPGKYKMASYSIQALQAVNAQLKIILAENKDNYPRDSNGEYYNKLGATPMIGRNDTLNEYFYRSDVEKLRKFCDKVGVRMISMWSLNRDKPISSRESATSLLFKSSKLPKGSKVGDYGNSDRYEFSKLLQRR